MWLYIKEKHSVSFSSIILNTFGYFWVSTLETTGSGKSLGMFGGEDKCQCQLLHLVLDMTAQEEGGHGKDVTQNIPFHKLSNDENVCFNRIAYPSFSRPLMVLWVEAIGNHLKYRPPQILPYRMRYLDLSPSLTI